jgi:16S rRNA (uracil1498-N3)-methyltransferase
VAQSKLAFLASAEAPPVLTVLPNSSNEEIGLLIIGPEGGNLNLECFISKCSNESDTGEYKHGVFT